ncbi:TPA: hypothetical protein DIV49_02575 [Candidatus Saccharibacteria bacterium]|nr:hypothetical protein [Candidatus Saccharibacteria bacterium]
MRDSLLSINLQKCRGYPLDIPFESSLLNHEKRPTKASRFSWLGLKDAKITFAGEILGPDRMEAEVRELKELLAQDTS